MYNNNNNICIIIYIKKVRIQNTGADIERYTGGAKIVIAKNISSKTSKKCTKFFD